jgi:hypothetical protein
MRSFHDRFGWLGSVLDILTFLPCTFSPAAALPSPASYGRRARHTVKRAACAWTD